MEDALIIVRDHVCRFLDCKSLSSLSCTSRVFRACCADRSRAHVGLANRKLRKLVAKGDDVVFALEDLHAFQYDLAWWFERLGDYHCLESLYERLQPYRDTYDLPFNRRDMLSMLVQHCVAKRDPEVKDLIYKVTSQMLLCERSPRNTMFYPIMCDIRHDLSCRYKDVLEEKGAFLLQDVDGDHSHRISRSSMFLARHLLEHPEKYDRALIDSERLIARGKSLLDDFNLRLNAFKSFRRKLVGQLDRLIGDPFLCRQVKRFSYRSLEVPTIDVS
jgi:hypothetical protein